MVTNGKFSQLTSSELLTSGISHWRGHPKPALLLPGHVEQYGGSNGGGDYICRISGNPESNSRAQHKAETTVETYKTKGAWFHSGIRELSLPFGRMDTLFSKNNENKHSWRNGNSSTGSKTCNSHYVTGALILDGQSSSLDQLYQRETTPSCPRSTSSGDLIQDMRFT